MTTQIRLLVEYVKSTERSPSRVKVGLSVPFLTLVWWVLLSIFRPGKVYFVDLTGEEQDTLYRSIVKAKIVNGLLHDRPSRASNK